MKTGAVGRKRKALKRSLKKTKKKEIKKIAQSPLQPPEEGEDEEEPLESTSLEQSHPLQSLGAESWESKLLETPDTLLDTLED